MVDAVQVKLSTHRSAEASNDSSAALEHSQEAENFFGILETKVSSLPVLGMRRALHQLQAECGTVNLCVFW